MATDVLKSIWPEWQLEEKPLGKGSYGVVYKAVRRDHNVESYAAIKVISIPSDPSEIDSLRSEGLDVDATKTYLRGVVDDFVGEIQLMESLKGTQNIVSVEDYKVVERTSEIGWDIYIRMELLKPFNTYIRDNKLTEKDVIKLGCDICSALEICSQRSVIHRDIKPENIFVNDFGHFKLGDFGIARKLENSSGGLSQKGTFNYMAPEVAVSGEYDARVDTYSLGIVLYRLLNGNRLPFLETDQQLSPSERKNAVERRLRGEKLPVPCDASPEMADLILRACAFNPDDRFSSAAQMHQALKDVEAGVYVADDMDKTTAVRQAQSSLDATTTVRKAAGNGKKTSEPAVGTFGDAPKKKLNKGKIIAIAIISGIVALAVALTVLFFTSAAYSVSRSMKDNDFNAALVDYRLDVEGDFLQEALLDVLLKDGVDNVVADYDGGKVTFADAIAELDALKEMGFDGAEEKRGEIKIKYADEILARFESGKMTYEEAMTELDKLAEMNCDEAKSRKQSVMAAYADQIIAQYKNGELGYNEAITALTGVKNDGYAEAQELINQITDSHNADDAMAKADEYYQKGEYEMAMAEYAKIPEGNEHYEEAQTKLQKVYADYISFVVEKAQQCNTANDFESAIQCVNDAYTVLPDTVDTSALDAVKAESVLAYKTEAIASADDLAANGDYRGAINAIEQASASVGEDSELQAKISEYSQAHISGTIDAAKALAADDEYTKALELLDEVIQYYPENDELQQARTEIAAAKETSTADARNPNQNPVPPKTPEEHNISGASSKSGATVVQKEDLYHSSFSTAGEVEWFKFTTSSNYSAYSIQILNNSINTTVYMTIYDAYDKQIKQVSVGKGETGYLDVSLKAKTEYWVRVHRYHEDRTGNYQFSVKEKICDAGMSKAEAFYTDLGTQYTKSMDVHGVNDWYQFTTTSNYATYQLSLTNNSINTTVYLTVYDEYDTKKGSISVGKGESAILDVELTAKRTYTVIISRYHEDRNGHYQMRISEMLCDGGLTQAEAVPLKLNETFYGKADTAFAEWYAYTFTQDGTYTLTLKNNSINATLYATVYDVLGTELGRVSASQNNTSQESLPITAGTVLYIKITRSYSDRFGNYTLLVS